MKRRIFVAHAGRAAALTAFATPLAAQTLETVNIGTLFSIADTPFLIAQAKGYFRDAGVRPKFIGFNSAALMVAPLGTGQLDAAGGAPSAGLYNAVHRGIGIKIVGDRGTDPPGYGFTALFVRTDLVARGKYTSYADLKGLRVTEPAKGASTFCQLTKACEKGGIAYSDLRHIFLGFPEQITGYQNGSIDAGVALEPFATLIANAGVARRVAGCDRFYPSEQITTIFFTDSFIERNPKLAQRFAVAYVRACRYYHDALLGGFLRGPTADDIISIVSAALKVKPQILREMHAAWIDPNAMVNVASLQEDYGMYRRAGLLAGNVPMDRVVDLSFVERAAKELGPYRPTA